MMSFLDWSLFVILCALFINACWLVVSLFTNWKRRWQLPCVALEVALLFGLAHCIDQIRKRDREMGVSSKLIIGTDGVMMERAPVSQTPE
jgi:hypothetical protein